MPSSEAEISAYQLKSENESINRRLGIDKALIEAEIDSQIFTTICVYSS